MCIYFIRIHLRIHTFICDSIDHFLSTIAIYKQSMKSKSLYKSYNACGHSKAVIIHNNSIIRFNHKIDSYY